MVRQPLQLIRKRLGTLSSRTFTRQPDDDETPFRVEVEELVGWCYRSILGRRPSAEQSQQLVEQVMNGMSEVDLIKTFVESPEARNRIEGASKYVPPGHYHSPLPSLDDIDSVYEGDYNGLAGVDLRTAQQVDLLERLAHMYESLPFQDEPGQGLRYGYRNSMYSYSDAIFLALMIRQFEPRRVIEIGSGHSSCVSLDVNDLYFDGRIECHFIEPYPDRLLSLLGEKDANSIRLVKTRLQDVPITYFSILQSSDILFIDSTHVSKVGSDVNYLFFDILPSLAPGVLIHIHDVFYPFEYPRRWLDEGRAWNEQYLLHAFLQYNSNFQIVLFVNQMVTQREDWFREHMPLCLRNPGGSIWLRRT